MCLYLTLKKKNLSRKKFEKKLRSCPLFAPGYILAYFIFKYAILNEKKTYFMNSFYLENNYKVIILSKSSKLKHL